MPVTSCCRWCFPEYCLRWNVVDRMHVQPDGRHSPPAFAIVDFQNNELYYWFFCYFSDDYSYKTGICFISDRAESIAYGVNQVYLEAGHYFCIYHMENNIKPKCRTSRTNGFLKQQRLTHKRNSINAC